MPRGVPVATVAINNATNAALLAVRMLGISDTDLVSRFFFFLSFLLLHRKSDKTRTREPYYK